MEKFVICGIFFIIIGAVSILFPQTFWKLFESWKSNADMPSRGYIIYMRITGVIGITLGIFLVVFPFFV